MKKNEGNIEGNIANEMKKYYRWRKYWKIETNIIDEGNIGKYIEGNIEKYIEGNIEKYWRRKYCKWSEELKELHHIYRRKEMFK